MTASVTPKEAQFYDEQYYQGQMDGSYRSAKKYADLLFKMFQPKSVIDVGCGRGTWLKAFKEAGAEKVVGLDGLWNKQENMVEGYITFYPFDLNKPINLPKVEKFDLAMSLEVAEHLEVSSAETFVSSLTNLADGILFGAAYTKQGGTNHINEQPHSYWANIFSSHFYVPFDIFRPMVWGDNDIEFWYRQNIFLYVRKGSICYQDILKKGAAPMKNVAFLDCVHPIMYEAAYGNKLNSEVGFKTSIVLAVANATIAVVSVKAVIRALIRAIKRRL